LERSPYRHHIVVSGQLDQAFSGGGLFNAAVLQLVGNTGL
jgi:hypothetical protein